MKIGVSATIAWSFHFVVVSVAAVAAPPPGVGPRRIDFSVHPLPSTFAESRATFAERAQAVLWATALEELPATDSGHFPMVAWSRLEVGHEIEAVNRAILDPALKPYALVGSDFPGFGKRGRCSRKGDYDFALRTWVRLLHRLWDRPDRLWPETRTKILHVMANERGARLETIRFFCGIPIPETENHILMTEGSQYLTNELLNRERIEAGLEPHPEFDNSRNGMSKWFLRHLQGFLLRDFEEYNSRPYLPYTISAIQNLHDFASDPRVRQMARAVLDYATAKFLVSSDGLRHLAPFRRREEYRDRWEPLIDDGETARLLALTGMGARLADGGGAPIWDFRVSHGAYQATSGYRPPLDLDELVFRGSEWSGFHRFSHSTTELYARSPGFLIAGGGAHAHLSTGGTHPVDIPSPVETANDGWALPTFLIPGGGRAAGLDARRWIRIEGDRRHLKRSNLCVGPGFACGLNPVVPQGLPSRQEGNWTFVEISGAYVAVFTRPCDTARCRRGADSWGFFEAAPADADGFDAFARRVVARNAHREFTSDRDNVYVASDGRWITFRPHPKGHRELAIRAIDDWHPESDSRRWPLADGEILRADGAGAVEIRNPLRGTRVVIDVSDPLDPRRVTDAHP